MALGERPLAGKHGRLALVVRQAFVGGPVHLCVCRIGEEAEGIIHAPLDFGLGVDRCRAGEQCRGDAECTEKFLSRHSTLLTIVR